MRLNCSECGASALETALFCGDCGGLLAFELDASAVAAPGLAELFGARRASQDPLDRSGVWRFRELLPLIPAAAVTTLRENDVPLYAAPAAARYAEVVT